MTTRLPALLLFLASVTVAAPAAAKTVRVEDDEGLRRALERAGAGTEIRIAPGTYRGGLFRRNLRGTEKRPVVIAGADRERPPVIRGGGCGLHLAGAAHVELRDLALRGAQANGLNVDDGGSFASPSHHVVLRRITVRDVGPEGNRDGIKLSGVEDFRVEDCVVERWGKGGSAIDTVGCHRGAITGCTFRHDDPPRADGVQMKGGSRGITVSRCRFEGAGGRGVNLGGSTGKAYFRPKDADHEAKDLTVEDCTFVGGGAAVAFVGVDGAVVRRCTIVRPAPWVLRILQETSAERFVPCRNGRFERNLIVFRSGDLRTAVNVGPATKPETFVFEGNFWYCEDAPDRSRPTLPVAEEGGVHGKDPEFVDPAKGDYRLKEGSPAKGRGRRP